MYVWQYFVQNYFLFFFPPNILFWNPIISLPLHFLRPIRAFTHTHTHTFYVLSVIQIRLHARYIVAFNRLMVFSTKKMCLHLRTRYGNNKILRSISQTNFGSVFNSIFQAILKMYFVSFSISDKLIQWLVVGAISRNFWRPKVTISVNKKNRVEYHILLATFVHIKDWISKKSKGGHKLIACLTRAR